MKPDGESHKRVGVYDRPPGADRKRGRWIGIGVGVLVTAAWIAYYVFGRG